MIEIKNRIKELRKEYGYTQESLAQALGLSSKSSIANYENGANYPSDDIKLKMCDIFNCSLDYLLGKTDIRNSDKQIDDVLNEAMIGMSAKEYDSLSENTKNAIKNFAIYMKEQEKGDKNK